MEESGNKEHDDNNGNVTNTSLINTKKGKGTCPDITYPSMMEEW